MVAADGDPMSPAPVRPPRGIHHRIPEAVAAFAFWVCAYVGLARAHGFVGMDRALGEYEWWLPPAAALVVAAPLVAARWWSPRLECRALSSTVVAVGLALSFMFSGRPGVPTVTDAGGGAVRLAAELLGTLAVAWLLVWDWERVAIIFRFLKQVRDVAMARDVGPYASLDIPDSTVHAFASCSLRVEHWAALADVFEPLYRDRLRTHVEELLGAYASDRRGKPWR